ncbi:MAG: asparaginase domain-containing protein [Ruminococcus sp.]|nr:asparaginase domain-containing protein [Ruminococcus sp.]
MKICVIFTGGTIGSSIYNSIINTSEETADDLLSAYKKNNPNRNIVFTSEKIMSVLSENMSLTEWKQIYNKINEIQNADYDGIIITHGTDTLAFTAAFLSMILAPIKIPILLVSSVFPNEHPRANGLRNFSAAVDFIREVQTRGVFVPFTSNSVLTKIHLGSRIQQSEPFIHTFRSIGNISYGRITANGFERNDNEFNPTPKQIETPPAIVIPRFPEKKNIVYITPYPGIDYSNINFKEKPDAIIHGLYHSGTACASPSDRKNSVVEFARQCIDQGIDFYAAPFDDRQKMYASSNIMQKTGIQFIKNVSCVAAYVKLIIAYGSFYDKDKADRKKFIESNIACEQFIQNENED